MIEIRWHDTGKLMGHLNISMPKEDRLTIPAYDTVEPWGPAMGMRRIEVEIGSMHENGRVWRAIKANDDSLKWLRKLSSFVETKP